MLLAFGNALLDHVLEVGESEHAAWVCRFGLAADVPQEADTVKSGMLAAVVDEQKRGR